MDYKDEVAKSNAAADSCSEDYSERLAAQDTKIEELNDRTYRAEERQFDFEAQIRKMRSEMCRLSETQEQLDKSG